jgi:hypothetical protein
VIGIAPNVYLLPGTATGNSLDITKNYITLLGLTNNRRSVVLADNRGNMQQDSGTNVPNGNGYVIVVNATGFTARNLTILNYCNTDYTTSRSRTSTSNSIRVRRRDTRCAIGARRMPPTSACINCIGSTTAWARLSTTRRS